MAPARANIRTTLFIFLVVCATVFDHIIQIEAPRLTYSCLNCNSLNMSSLGSVNHLLKVYGVVSLKSDVIFLSDIRLCNAQGVSDIKRISDSFRVNPYGSYSFFHNSKTNKRGVGILISNKIVFSVTSEDRDADGNILGLKVDLQGCKSRPSCP
jgi:hypothetical protein